MLKTFNVKADRPSVLEALQRLEKAVAMARAEGEVALKIVHGYGSSGVGGDIRIAVQRRLREMAEAKQIQGCIFGEDWSMSSEETWRLLQTRREFKRDVDLGRRNRGITIVLL